MYHENLRVAKADILLCQAVNGGQNTLKRDSRGGTCQRAAVPQQAQQVLGVVEVVPRLQQRPRAGRLCSIGQSRTSYFARSAALAACMLIRSSSKCDDYLMTTQGAQQRRGSSDNEMQGQQPHLVVLPEAQHQAGGAAQGPQHPGERPRRPHIRQQPAGMTSAGLELRTSRSGCFHLAWAAGLLATLPPRRVTEVVQSSKFTVR